MLIDNEFISDDTMNFEDFNSFEFSPILDESADKKRAPFTPNSGGFPPLGNYPPNFNFNPPNLIMIILQILITLAVVYSILLERLNLHHLIMSQEKMILEFKKLELAVA